MTSWLANHAHLDPDALALSTDQGDRLTYAELRDAVARRAAALADLGLRPGDALGLHGANSLSWALTAHAAWWLGATLVPLHLRATDADLQHQRQVLPLSLELSEARGDLARLDDLSRKADPAPAHDLRPDTVLTVLFTSGSTGTSRAVPLTLANHSASALGSRQRLGVRDDDLWLACLPLYHAGGLAILLRSAIYGTAVHLADGFDPARTLATLGSRPITLASFVPTMVRRLLDAADDRDATAPIESNLRAVLVGGGPIAASDLHRARGRGLPVLPTYGMTEASSQLTTLALDAPDADLHTTGTALPGVELRVVHGEIRVRGPMITAGYLNAPTPLDDQGFFCTGDRGSVRSDGALVIHHRETDLIVSGGENVSPDEVEQTLRGVDAVHEVVVFGLDDDEWGEVVAAAVVASPGNPGESDAFFSDLEAHCRAHLARFKVPRQWFLLTELPVTATGKLHRRALRDQLSPPDSTVEP